MSVEQVVAALFQQGAAVGVDMTLEMEWSYFFYGAGPASRDALQQALEERGYQVTIATEPSFFLRLFGREKWRLTAMRRESHDVASMTRHETELRQLADRHSVVFEGQEADVPSATRPSAASVH